MFNNKPYFDRLKKRTNFYDIGLIATVLFLFILLPMVVWHFNPDDSPLFPMELIEIGGISSLLFILVYFIINFILNIPILVKKAFTAFAIFLFVIIVFYPTKTGMIAGFRLNDHFDSSMLINLILYFLLLSMAAIFVFFMKKSSLIKNVSFSLLFVGIVIVGYIGINGAFYGEESKRLFWETFEGDQVELDAFVTFGTKKKCNNNSVGRSRRENCRKCFRRKSGFSRNI